MSKAYRSAIVMISLTILLCTACGTKKKRVNKRPQIVIKNSTIKELVNTLSEAIKKGDKKAIRKLYTKKSRETIKYNNRIGIGTAGTADQLIMNEINKPRKNKELRILYPRGKNLYTIHWFSGKKFSLKIVQENKKYLIDIIDSPGGKILILKE